MKSIFSNEENGGATRKEHLARSTDLNSLVREKKEDLTEKKLLLVGLALHGGT